MENKAFFRLALTAITLGAGVFTIAIPARAAETQLIWSANSALANQSTEALRDGRLTHAVRFAKDVLRTKTHPANQLIARHNLCLAYSAQGKTDDAKPFCDLALGTQARYRITHESGRLVVAPAESPADAGTETLEAAVRANLARIQGGALAENR